MDYEIQVWQIILAIICFKFGEWLSRKIREYIKNR